MAYRRSPADSSNRYSVSSPPHPRQRKPAHRRSPIPEQRALTLRPVLATLPANLRRLPSRLYLDKDPTMRDGIRSDFGLSVIGAKRKRIASTNENAHTATRDSGRLKRLRSGSIQSANTSDDGASAMDIDVSSRWESEAGSDEVDEEEEEEEEESSDDYLLNSAPQNQLQRLKKDELIRLYISLGDTDPDPQLLTKVEIANAIIAARDDFASLPPTSPPRGDENSSECSSDDAAGDEDVLPTRIRPSNGKGLRRRATYNISSPPNGKPPNGRTLSLGNMHPDRCLFDSLGSDRSRRRRTTFRPSPPAASKDPLSPPATRLRSRKASNATVSGHPPFSGSSSSNGSRKGKGKSSDTRSSTSPSTSTLVNGSSSHLNTGADESDLTDLDELENQSRARQPLADSSPRRLRSQNRVDGKTRSKTRSKESRLTSSIDDAHPEGVTPQPERRIVPMRKAKRKIQNLKEEDTEEDIAEDDSDTESTGTSEEDELQEEEEVEKLAPSIPTQRRRLAKKLRSQQNNRDASPSDGDDEAAQDEEDDEEEEEDHETKDGDKTIEEEDEEDLLNEPRKLRNGKIVGEMEMEVENDDENVESDEAVEEELVEEAEEDEDDEDEEAEEEDADLSAATQTTLCRLRRDNLVKLCENRDLSTTGTKPQLAASLLQWRDRHATELSSPSSTVTVRPPSSPRRRRRRSSDDTQKTPILERSHHVHLDEPRTPQPSQPEPELELDLESLGLDDREIPPEKLTKLEKIGSGGFKDVFIGKYKGRKVAISEFRGQLNAMDIKELKLLGGFNHPNIVRFLGVSIPENTKDVPVMIVSELCSNGDLFDYIRNIEVPPSLHRVLSMMSDIARGLEYLHLCKPSVIHRDCKSSNILITSKGVAKIADFGLAKVKQSTRSMVRSLVGTVNWQAPELWHAHPKYNHKVDVFSCAMVFWEMLQWHAAAKKFPWEGMNEHAIYEIVGQKKQRPSVSGLRKLWGLGIVDLMERMWAQDHQDRPTMTEIVEELEQLIRAR